MTDRQDARSVATVDAVPDCRQPDATSPLVGSIVVPTRNEAANVAELIRRLSAATASTAIEVIFVDDSEDDTPAVIEAVGRSAALPIRLIHRPAGQRSGGLGGAVVEGIRAAAAPWVCVMDADLQHPPELVPTLLATADQRDVDVVVASRYCVEGDAASFGHARAWVSQGSTTAARAAFPGRLRGVSDPMSGFFVVRRAAIDADSLQPHGFKILLEILCRTPNLRRVEVPFRFGNRFAGESKASLREGVRYIQLLAELRFGPRSRRFARFAAVGVSGLLVNSFLLAFGAEVLAFYYLIAALLATQGSTLWNFCLTEFWVFSGRNGRTGRWRRCAMFFGMNNAALGIRGPAIYALTTGLHVNYLVSNLASLVAIMVLRYFLADRLIWVGGQPRLEPSPAFAVVGSPSLGEGV